MTSSQSSRFERLAAAHHHSPPWITTRRRASRHASAVHNVWAIASPCLTIVLVLVLSHLSVSRVFSFFLDFESLIPLTLASRHLSDFVQRNRWWNMNRTIQATTSISLATTNRSTAPARKLRSLTYTLRSSAIDQSSLITLRHCSSILEASFQKDPLEKFLHQLTICSFSTSRNSCIFSSFCWKK